MKRLGAVLAVVIPCVVSCASYELVNYNFIESETIYETDFDTLDDLFTDESNGGIVEIRNGELYLEGGSEKRNYSRAKLNIPYGDNSLTSFKMKLADDDSSISLHFLSSDERYLGLSFYDDQVNGYFGRPGSWVWHRIARRKISSGQWHDIAILIVDDDLSVFIDGKLAGNLKIKRSFVSDTGCFKFMAYRNESYYVDDLRIVNLESFTIE